MNLEKLLEDRISPALVGLCQALGVVVYTVLVAGIITFLGNIENSSPQIVAIPVFLTLLVLSAGVTGTIVFGLPVYFALRNNIRRAISIIAFTFLSLLVMLLLAAVTILTVY